MFSFLFVFLLRSANAFQFICKMKHTAVLIGAGNRGQIYAKYAKKHDLKITAVADPDPLKRQRIAALHEIPPSQQFSSMEHLLQGRRLADGAILATMDSMHAAPAIKALKLGYHVMLEKPMGLTIRQCEEVAAISQRQKKSVLLCHVLRYTSLFARIKDILSSGTIGNIASILHTENITPFHMAHSYVRGNWRNSKTSSPLILAKCSHDLDLISWFADSRAIRVSSAGGISHFRPENKPVDAAARCLDCRSVCPHNAYDLYIHATPMLQSFALNRSAAGKGARLLLLFPFLKRLIPGTDPWTHWPTSTFSDGSKDQTIAALKDGPFGQCVYSGLNDQVDHQETWIEFENGTTASFRFQGLAPQEGRTLRVDGSLGCLHATTMNGGSLKVILHRGKTIHFKERFSMFGHAEGDEKIVLEFKSVLDEHPGRSDARSSLESHRIAFAANESRLSGRVVKI